MAKVTVKRKKRPEGPKPRVAFIPKTKRAVDDELPADPWQTVMKAYKNQGTGKKKPKKKADTEVNSTAAEVEDDLGLFGNLADGKGIINPPVTPTDLEILVMKNSILPPLVDIMEVNVDGTGWEITPKDQDDVEDEETGESTDPESESDENQDPFAEIEAKEQAAVERQGIINEAKRPIEDFFNECWPGVSFLTVRRRLRRDQEKVGYAYMEVLRNDQREVTLLRRIDPKKMRLVRLDDPIEMDRTVFRDGKPFTVQMPWRARRYVQIIGRRIIYFKEFGDPRDMDRLTGEFAPEGQQLPADQRATEIIFFKNKEDVATPYGVPRWMSNVPSVVGSREAEEFNLEFFDSGGIPPLMILVQGGSLATDVEQQLRDSFGAAGSPKHQAAILEAYAVGDMESAKNVKVTVERFGAEQQKDSMFETYMNNSDKRVQRSFRMPSIFLGMSEDFSFATAFASYVVAEAQVFAPERTEFDEIINLQLMPELPNGTDFEFRSLPLTLSDTANQLEAATLIKDMVEPVDFVDEVNGIVNTNFQPKSERILQEEAEKEREANEERLAQLNGNAPAPTAGPPGGPPADSTPGETPAPGGPASVQRAIVEKGIEELAELAERGAELMRKGFGDAGTAKAWLAHRERVAALKDEDRGAYEALLAAKTFEVVEHDPKGMAELAGCAAEVLAANQ